MQILGRFKCSVCLKTFGQKKNLNQHFNRKHFNRRYECFVCQEQLSSGFRLKSHLLRFHKKKIDSAQSYLVVQGRQLTTVAPEAKKHIILANHKKILTLEAKLKKIEINKQLLKAKFDVGNK